MSRRALVWGLAAALILASCTSLPVIVPDRAPVWTRTVGVRASIPDILSAQRRLHTVAFPILRTASEFCDVTKPFFGLSAAGGDNLSTSRDSGEPRGYTTDAGARVLYAVPDSPADLVGLREGDVVLSLDGGARPGGSRGSQFLFDAMEEFDGFYLRFVVRRGTVRQLVQISPVEICDIELDLAVSTAIGAWAHSNKVTVSDAMLRFVENDDELAFAISHEISHIILGHSGSFGRRSVNLEREADHVGLYLMARAGYDANRGIYLLVRMAEAFPWSDDSTRYDAIAQVAIRIGQ